MNLIPHIMKLIDRQPNGVETYECPICLHRVGKYASMQIVLFFGDLTATHIIDKGNIINQVDNGLDEIDRIIQDRLAGDENEFRYINLSPIDEPPPVEGTQETVIVPANDPQKFFEALGKQFKPSQLETDKSKANQLRKQERAQEHYDRIASKLLADIELEDL